MNFSEDERPIVLIGVDLMIRAEERRKRVAAEGIGFACLGPGGRMKYVNGKPRDVVYCPSCKPLRRQPHRCAWAPGGVDVDRYWRVRNQMYARAKEIVMAKKLSEIARIRTAYAEANPYRAGYRTSEYRSRWKGDVDIEYYTNGDAAHLNIRGTLRSPTEDEVRQVRNVFDVPDGAVCKMPKQGRDDGMWIATMEWQTAKQAAMVLA